MGNLKERTGVRVCPFCGRTFVVPSLGSWMPKMYIPENPRGEKTVYFCKLSCRDLYREMRKATR